MNSNRLATCLAGVALSASIWQVVQADEPQETRTPIKHVILIIGENRSFDHVFATYTPPHGQTVSNLLFKGIITKDGTPGPKVALARQWQATNTGAFSISPTKAQAYGILPDINTNGAPTVPFAASAARAQTVEPALPAGDYFQLASGGTNLPTRSVDTRFPPNLPNAPVDTSRSISYNDYAGSPVHRFFQMWQQLDCSAKAATERLVSLGCDDCGRRSEWGAATGQLHRPDDRSRLDLDAVSQCG
jgi:phospholipase C